MLVVPMFIGFTACEDEEASYTPANPETGHQVYFSAEESDDVISLTEGQNSVSISVYRADSVGDLTVPVTLINDTLGTFTCPSEVNFAAGQTVATLEVSFSEIEADTEYSCSVELGQYTNGYGKNTKTITIKYAPWSEWEEIEGTHTYTYATYYSGADKGVHVFTRASLLNPNNVQYMVYLNAYNDGTYYLPMTIDLDRSTGYCKVTPFWTGEMYEPGDGSQVKVMTGDIISVVYATGFNPLKASALEEYNNETCPSTFNPETGLFSLYMMTYVEGLGWFGYDYETLQLDGYKQYDYSATLAFQGHYIGADNVDRAVVSLQLGADVASYKYAFVNQKLGSSNISALYEAISSGNIVDGEGTESGYLLVEAGEGDNTVAVLTYDAEGNQVGEAFVTFEFHAAGSDYVDPWVSMGYGRLTDDIYSSLLFDGATDTWITYSVEVFENIEKPGLYRVLNPLSPDVYPVEITGATYPEGDFYMEINAEDPEGVYIPYQSLGANWGLGEFYIYSMAAMGLDQGATLDQVKAEGYCGTLVDGVITFPVKGLLWTGADMGGSLYYGNVEGKFKLDMSNLTAEPIEPEAGAAWFAGGKPAARKAAARGTATDLKAPKSKSKVTFMPFSTRINNSKEALDFELIPFNK